MQKIASGAARAQVTSAERIPARYVRIAFNTNWNSHVLEHCVLPVAVIAAEMKPHLKRLEFVSPGLRGDVPTVH